MNLTTCRTLIALLVEAEAVATAAGKVDVDLTATLARADDVARAALQAAIDRSEQHNQ